MSLSVHDKNLIQFFQSLILERLNQEIDLATTCRKKYIDPSDKIETYVTKNITERLLKLTNLPKHKLEAQVTAIIASEYHWFIKALQLGKAVSNLYPPDQQEKALFKGLQVALFFLGDGITSLANIVIKEVSIDSHTRHVRIKCSRLIRKLPLFVRALIPIIAEFLAKNLYLQDFTVSEQVLSQKMKEYTLFLKISKYPMETPELIAEIITGLNVELFSALTEITDLNKINSEDLDIFIGFGELLSALLVELPHISTLLKNNQIPGFQWLHSIAEKYDETTMKKLGQLRHILTADNVISPEITSHEYLLLTHEFSPRGFLLRTGRAATTGLGVVGVHPSFFPLLDLLPGTQIIIGDRNPLMCTLQPVIDIRPPIVLLKNEKVIALSDAQAVSEIKENIEKILSFGDIICSSDDLFLLTKVGFKEEKKSKIKCSFCETCWLEDLTMALQKKKTTISEEKLELINQLVFYLKMKQFEHIEFETLKEICAVLEISLPPDYTPFWSSLSAHDFKSFLMLLKKIKFLEPINQQYFLDITNLAEEEHSFLKEIFIKLLITFESFEGKIKVSKNWFDLLKYIQSTVENFDTIETDEGGIEAIISTVFPHTFSFYPTIKMPIKLRRIFTNDLKKTLPPIHTLFPRPLETDVEPNLLYLLKKSEKKYTFVLNLRQCSDFHEPTFLYKCPECSKRTNLIFECERGHLVNSEICDVCGSVAVSYKKWTISGNDLLKLTYNVSVTTPTLLSPLQIRKTTPFYEDLRKGILRAKYGLYVSLDGTTRILLQNQVLTHFRLKDIGLSVETARKLGYFYDLAGKKIENDDQIIALYPTDIVLGERDYEWFEKLTHFIDDEIVKIYGQKPYFNLKNPTDLIGHIIVGIPPNGSIGRLGRIIGLLKNEHGCFAHPHWHVSKNRTANGDIDSYTFALDVLINFSKNLAETQNDIALGIPQLLDISMDFLYSKSKTINPLFKPLKEKIFLLFQNLTTITPLIETSLHEGEIPSEFPIFGIPPINFAPTVELPPITPLTVPFDHLSFILQQLKFLVIIDSISTTKMLESTLQVRLKAYLDQVEPKYAEYHYYCPRCQDNFKHLPKLGLCPNCQLEVESIIDYPKIRKILHYSQKLTKMKELSSKDLPSWTKAIRRLSALVQ